MENTERTQRGRAAFLILFALFLLMFVSVAGLFIYAILTGKAPDYDSQVKGAIEAQGFDFVKIESSSYNTVGNKCSNDDTIAYVVLSTNQRCDLVRHSVCVGYYKGATLRGGEVVQRNYSGCVTKSPPQTP